MRGIARDSPEVKPLLSASLPLVMVFAPCQPRILDIVWVNGPWREWGIYRDFQAASHAWAGWRPMHSYAIWVGPTVRPACIYTLRKVKYSRLYHSIILRHDGQTPTGKYKVHGWTHTAQGSGFIR